LQVIIITGHGNVETAVKATKVGAFDLIEKPLSIDKVIVDINKALNFRRLEEENRFLRKKTIEKHSISGSSPAIQDLKKQIAVVAPTDSWVLIMGENGTGKELVARTIHLFSPRAEQPFIDINCAALSEIGLEMELFGYEKNAFEGAFHRKRGRFETAGEGTLFLDEISDMSLGIQAKLLRVLQEQKFQRMGGGRPIKTQVRVIAATNRDLESEIQKGRFREDLYFRINEIPVMVPPLRSRGQDIGLLVKLFLDEKTAQNEIPQKSISPDALEMLCAYSWPGNVRELKNLMGRLALMSEKQEITASEIPAPYNPGLVRRPAALNPLQPFPGGDSLFGDRTLSEAMTHFEQVFISRKYEEHNRDLTRFHRNWRRFRSENHRR
jgi:two-component system nitrogen regulation response regulator NtrX